MHALSPLYTMDYNKLNVEQLKALLAEKGLDIKGRKGDLIGRLTRAEQIEKDNLRTPNQTSCSLLPGSHAFSLSENESILCEESFDSPPTAFFDVSIPQKENVTENFTDQFVRNSSASSSSSEISRNIETSNIDISALTEQERIALRKQKFGILDSNAEEAKKLQRAQRFSLITPETEQVKKQARAARFGVLAAPTFRGSNESYDELEVEKRKRRADRFGITSSEKEKKKLRATRFGSNFTKVSTKNDVKEKPVSIGAESWAAKIAARQLRFGTVSATMGK